LEPQRTAFGIRCCGCVIDKLIDDLLGDLKFNLLQVGLRVILLARLRHKWARPALRGIALTITHGQAQERRRRLAVRLNDQLLD
jgi:hypothetical protein